MAFLNKTAFLTITEFSHCQHFHYKHFFFKLGVYNANVKIENTGDKVIDGVKYRFDSNGCQQTGLQEFSDGIR